MNSISNNCTGCGLCAAKCPKSAIVFVKNERKEIVSQIDESKCIECGLCQKLCPELSAVKSNIPQKCYAAWTKNESDYNSTASGGIATVLSKWCVNNDGVVYGAEMLSDGYVKHDRIDTTTGLDRLKGSKYVQSDFRNVFSQLKKDIQLNRNVVVIGVPCQIAAVKSGFSAKELEKVFLVDLVCHGCPPNDYFKDYLRSLALPYSENRLISFRNKDYFLKVTQNDEIVYKKRWQVDSYFRSFMYALIYRENCYECKYAKPERVSDLTLSDFWGLDKKTLKQKKAPSHVSCILVNTSKGEQLMDYCKNDIEFEERCLKEAVVGNYNLNKPSERHRDRELFLNGIKKNLNFIESVNRTTIKKEILVSKFMNILKIPYRFIRYRKWTV